MSFPAFPRDPVIELYVAGTWVEVGADVYVRDQITVSRGRPNEASNVQAARCGLTFKNTSGNYSPRNPLGQWWGSLGRNTPIRAAIRVITDAFARTVSSGWGSADTGQAWTTGVGSGGTIAASDWNVAAGVATHSVPAASAYRASYLGSVSYRDVDVRVDATLPFSNVTGDQVEPANLMLRGQSTSNYYLVRVAVEADESVTIDLRHADDTVITAAVTVAGLTHTGQTLRVRAQCEGETIRAKVWPAAGSEPYGWHVTGHSSRITTAGWVGIRSGVSAANTNTKPIAFSYDAVEVKLPRFAGEISAWPPRSDVSGNDRYVPIEAAGILRRLGQGASPLQSTLRRAITTVSPAPVAYWPCEDGEGATSFASGLGGSPMLIFGTPTLATSSAFVASDKLPQCKGSVWIGDVPADQVTGNAQVRFLLAVPSGGAAAADQKTIFRADMAGTAVAWSVYYYTGGALALKAFDRNGVNLLDTGAVAFAADGAMLRVSIELTQSGSDINWKLVTVAQGALTGGFLSGTLTGRTAVRPIRVFVNPENALDDTVIGHVSVYSTITSIFDLTAELVAFNGETAGARIVRLCAQEGVELSYRGDLSTSAAMGPQPIASLLSVLQECEAADMGILGESRGSAGLTYRTRSSLYSQPAAVALDYASQHIAPPLEATEDDQLLRNDVTVKRTTGSSSRVIQETGPLSVLSPDQGGVGRYDTETTLNVLADTQLPDIASWQVQQGTVDEARYPVIRVDMAAAAISASAALAAALLDVDQGDRLTLDHPPAGHAPDQITQIVRGYAETIDLYAHDIAFNCSPASPYRALVLDDPVLGRLDSDDSTLHAGISSGAASFTVDIAGSTLWTTDPAQMPIPIMIGGEEMSVGAISGASSPQTFSSVARSVNGVVKAHSAGDQVRVARHAAIAL